MEIKGKNISGDKVKSSKKESSMREVYNNVQERSLHIDNSGADYFGGGVFGPKVLR